MWQQPTGSQQQFQQRHDQRREVMQDAAVHGVCHAWLRRRHCAPCAVPAATAGRLMVSELDLNIKLWWPGAPGRSRIRGHCSRIRGPCKVFRTSRTGNPTRAIREAIRVGEGRYAGPAPQRRQHEPSGLCDRTGRATRILGRHACCPVAGHLQSVPGVRGATERRACACGLVLPEASAMS